MTLHKALSFLLVLAMSLAISACSSSGWTKMKQPLSQKIPGGKSVALTVKVDTPEHQKDEDFTTITTRIRQQLFTKLMSEGIFKSVLLPPEPADYGMEVTITSARVVSGTARLWGGLMAGHNDAQMFVKLVKNDDNQTVAEFEVDGTSASHPFSSESGTDDAIREATDQIIKGLR